MPHRPLRLGVVAAGLEVPWRMLRAELWTSHGGSFSDRVNWPLGLPCLSRLLPNLADSTPKIASPPHHDALLRDQGHQGPLPLCWQHLLNGAKDAGEFQEPQRKKGRGSLSCRDLSGSSGLNFRFRSTNSPRLARQSSSKPRRSSLKSRAACDFRNTTAPKPLGPSFCQRNSGP